MDDRNVRLPISWDGTAWIADRSIIHELWYGGCFGKGTWSRSLPEFALATVPATEQREVDGASQNVDDFERLQLSPVETVFLGWSVQCIDCIDSRTSLPVNMNAVWKYFALDSVTRSLPDPIPSSLSNWVRNSSDPWPMCQKLVSQNKFFQRFLSYYHYRRQGLIVRDGIKFASDWLLYQYGPTLDHAFACVTVLSRPMMGSPIGWVDVLAGVRVCSSVKKRLRLCVVQPKAPIDVESIQDFWIDSLDQLYSDPDSCLQLFTIQEVDITRWIPERTRE